MHAWDFIKSGSTVLSLDCPGLFLSCGGAFVLFLSEHEGDARPDTLVYMRVTDVRPIAEEFCVEVQEPPWATYEIELRDPDGNQLRVGTPKT
jgi:hypothetical protein